MWILRSSCNLLLCSPIHSCTTKIQSSFSKHISDLAPTASYSPRKVKILSILNPVPCLFLPLSLLPYSSDTGLISKVPAQGLHLSCPPLLGLLLALLLLPPLIILCFLMHHRRSQSTLYFSFHGTYHRCNYRINSVIISLTSATDSKAREDRDCASFLHSSLSGSRPVMVQGEPQQHSCK